MARTLADIERDMVSAGDRRDSDWLDRLQDEKDALLASLEGALRAMDHAPRSLGALLITAIPAYKCIACSTPATLQVTHPGDPATPISVCHAHLAEVVTDPGPYLMAERGER